eukprot:5255728-Amphidinium_carterae.1
MQTGQGCSWYSRPSEQRARSKSIQPRLEEHQNQHAGRRLLLGWLRVYDGTHKAQLHGLCQLPGGNKACGAIE